jgi:23S rRNA (adenine2503-C2)-methyltransferase
MSKMEVSDNERCSQMTVVKTSLAGDKSRKYLICTGLGEYIEAASLFLPDLYPQHAFCISTQVGCYVGCKFCASGGQRFTRNLTTSEIISEVQLLYSLISVEVPFRVAFMGIGEPFHNYHNVIEAIKYLASNYENSCQRISVSTIGIPKLIEKFAEETAALSGINLQISLHFADEKRRIQYMPGTSHYPLEHTINACNNYIHKTGKRLHIAYLLFDRVNDDIHDAQRLLRLLAPLDRNFLLKISMYNPAVDTKELSPALEEKVIWFGNILREHGLAVETFRSHGVEIKGGCGQMRAEYGV